jgi:hypothetical protein
MEWVPIGRRLESHVDCHGATPSQATSTPSMNHFTWVTAMSSEALAVRLTVPLTIEPAVGLVTLTVGARWSGRAADAGVIASIPISVRIETPARAPIRRCQLSMRVVVGARRGTPWIRQERIAPPRSPSDRYPL